MRYLTLVLFLAFAMMPFCIRGEENMNECKLVPMPRELHIVAKEGVVLDSEWVVYVSGADEQDSFAAELLLEEIKNCYGWDWKVVTALKNTNKIVEIMTMDAQPSEPELFNKQGYLLALAPGRIEIKAPAHIGRFYGVQTLRQLIRASTNASLPQLRIKDYPALEWRGISDDISRGQVSTVDDFKQIIRDLAYYKKNLYQPYIEDMFSFDINPSIGRERGAVTKTEMALMVEEAQRNHVTLTPVFESLGHQDRLLGLPENRKYAELQDPETRPWSFSPVLPEAFAFLKILIDEVAEATPSPFFHIGGDESFDIGKGTSKKQVEKLGVGRVHAEFFARLHDYISSTHDRRMMLYADMLLHHPESLEYLPKDCIMVDWHYSQAEDYPSVKQLKDAGFTHIMASPGIWSWNVFYPNYGYALKNVGVFTAVAKRENVYGCITSSWGDNGAENLRENNWLGYAYSAAAEWEKDTPDEDAFIRRFVAVHYGIDSPALARAEKNLGWIDDLGSRYSSQVFHRTPQIKIESDEWLDTMRKLEERMMQVREAVADSRNAVRFRRDHLDVMEHVADRYLYMASRFRVMSDIARMLADKKSGDLPRVQQEQIVTRLSMLRDNLIKITCDFENLWLRRNKFPMLQFNLERLQNQVGALQGFIAQTLVGDLAASRVPEAVWFWYPDEDPAELASEGTRYFVREFEVRQTVTFARIKCWADDKATVYINGEKVLNAEYGRPVQTQTVTSRIKKGSNYIAIEGSNSVGAAGILLELQVNMLDKSTLIITGDELWMTAISVGKKWQTQTPKGKKWQPVKLLGKGLIKHWTFIDW